MAVTVQEIKDGIAAGVEISVSIAGGEVYEQPPVLTKGLRIECVRPAGIDLGSRLLHLRQHKGEHHEVKKLFHRCGFNARLPHEAGETFQM